MSNVGNAEIKKLRTEDEEKKEKIKSFFEKNRTTIINETISSFEKMEKNNARLPYEVEHKLATSLYFGCSRNQYNDMLERMISEEIRRHITWPGAIRVYVTIRDEEKGCWLNAVTFKKTGYNRVMYIQVLFSQN